MDPERSPARAVATRARPTPSAPDEASDQARPNAEAAVSVLEALGAELGHLGWTARLHITAGKPPALRVANPR